MFIRGYIYIYYTKYHEIYSWGVVVWLWRKKIKRRKEKGRKLHQQRGKGQLYCIFWVINSNEKFAGWRDMI